MKGIFKVVWRRLLVSIPVLLAVYTLTFMLVHSAPGGPFDTERIAPPSVMKALEARYNLDAPLYEQYFTYLGHALTGDLGPSFRYAGRSVIEIIGNGLPITLELGVYSLGFAVLVGMLAGVIAALRKNTAWDYVPMSLAIVGICVPTFLLGPFLIYILSIKFQILPISGWLFDPAAKVMPVITLGLAYCAYVARLTRAGMLEELGQDHIRTARAKGVPEWSVTMKHAMRGGVIPVVAFLGPAAAGLLAGSFVVENVFEIPGLGREYIRAAFNRDYTMILGMTLLLSVLVILFNLLSDILVAILNPRARSQDQSS